MKLLTDEEAARRINEEDIKLRAIERVEQQGIVFIDELDKVTNRAEAHGADVSREGVQRDLLPLVEGCTVNTKHGMVRTDHILFIASGAFHLSKPSDLIPELQGRLPIRVELSALSVEDFVRILIEPDASLTEQYQALMTTEGVDLEFTEDGIRDAVGSRGLGDVYKRQERHCRPLGTKREHPRGKGRFHHREAHKGESRARDRSVDRLAPGDRSESGCRPSLLDPAGPGRAACRLSLIHI